MKTKTNKIEMNNYIYSLALQLKEKLENEDIMLLINFALSLEEKEELKKQLQKLKIEVKTPVDYQVNRKIYRAIAIIMDKTNLQNKAEKQIKEDLKKQYQNTQTKPFQNRTNLSSNY